MAAVAVEGVAAPEAEAVAVSLLRAAVMAVNHCPYCWQASPRFHPRQGVLKPEQMAVWFKHDI